MMIIVLGMMFLVSIQPIVMVVMLIFITLVYSVYIYMMVGGYWFSYALIMIMLSGVLVVFTYMASLVPNESFEVYSLIFLLIFFMLVFDNLNFFMGEDMGFMSLNLWMSYVSVFSLFLVSFLLGIMIMVVWLSCLIEGAIRAM